MEAAASGRAQGVTYEFLGPWYDLANTHYLQTFQGVAVLPYAPGEIVLNTSTANNSHSTRFSSASAISSRPSCNGSSINMPRKDMPRRFNTWAAISMPAPSI